LEEFDRAVTHWDKPDFHPLVIFSVGNLQREPLGKEVYRSFEVIYGDSKVGDSLDLH
jgi:hypothetical protein